jgi:hypothetical protein
VALLHATVPPRLVSPQSLLAASAGTQAYLELGSGRTYYPITSMHIPNRASSSALVGLSFDTSSVVLLGQVLQAAAGSRRISHVSIALRAPGADGRPATELVDTFATATVASFEAHLSGQPAGHVSLVLPAQGSTVTAPGALGYVGPFAPLPGPSGVPTARAYATLGRPGTGATFSEVTAVTLARAAPRAPLDLSFATSSLPLLQAIFQDEGAGVTIPAFTLSVRAGPGGPDRFTFSGLNVTSFAENLAAPVSGTATLAVRRR